MSYGPNTDELLKRIAEIRNGCLCVSHLQLTGLPELPDDITFLNCCWNPDLKELPKLPKNLKYLVCCYTAISSLPTLPKTLVSLYCENTPLTFLPELPPNLYSLLCKNTQIEALPEFPYSLKFREGEANLDFSYTPAARLYYEPGVYGNQILRKWRQHWRKESEKRVQERCSKIKRELMETVWHPARLTKLLDTGIDYDSII